MRRIRVLVVDDSVVIRRLLTDALSRDPEIEVVGTAPNGRIALVKLPQLCPDLLTLDVEMPELDGLEMLPLLRKDYPKLPVIMFSTLTERGAAATFDALARGATDFVAKPANVGNVAAGFQNVKDQLIPKIKALCPSVPPAMSATAQVSRPLRWNLNRPVPGEPKRRDVIVIGSSTGGPQALAVLLGKLPANFPVPIAVVQHMPPVFTRHLAARLNQVSLLTVREAAAGDSLRPGLALVAPGGRHMELERRGVVVTTVLHEGPPENSCRPAVDVLFRSAAAVFGPGCLAVVLTGMGRDGLRGGEWVVRSGGTVVAQDEASSVVWGMPRAVTEAGLAAQTLPLDSIAPNLLQAAAVGRRPVINC